MAIDWISFAYAATVAGGGIMGYVKANSIPSLSAGLLFGGVLFAGAVLTSRNPNNYWPILGTSAVLGGVMGYRWVSGGKFMPAGLVCVLSVAMVLRFGARAAGLTDVQKVRE